MFSNENEPGIGNGTGRADCCQAQIVPCLCGISVYTIDTGVAILGVSKTGSVKEDFRRPPAFGPALAAFIKPVYKVRNQLIRESSY